MVILLQCPNMLTPSPRFIPHLEEPKRIQLQKILERLDTIAAAASQAKVPVLIDAEHVC